jgi:hypothetical protein
MENIIYRGFKIEIGFDQDCENPIEYFDHVSIACFHNCYDLGNRQNETIEDIEQEIKNEQALFLPIYMYDHSGITINTTGFSCPWDSGQIGYVFITRTQILKEYESKILTKKIKQKVYESLQNIIKTYSAYLEGNVFYYLVKDCENNFLDSCGGYIDDYYFAISEAKDSIDYHIEQKIKNHLIKLKTWIKNNVPIHHRTSCPVF